MVAQKIGGAIILTIVTFLLVYAVVFKDDFKKEDIDKVTPFLAVIFIIVLVFNILNMIIICNIIYKKYLNLIKKKLYYFK